MAKSSSGTQANPFDPFGFFGQWQDLLSQSVPGGQQNPFDPFGLLKAAPFDFSKACDPFQVTKSMTASAFPGVDTTAIVDGQRKNLEAVQKAQEVAFSGMLALVQRQADLLRETLEEVTRVAQDAVQGAGSGDAAAKQQAAFQTALHKGFGLLQELTEMIAKANSETFEVINQRFQEGLEEIRGMAPSIE